MKKFSNNMRNIHGKAFAVILALIMLISLAGCLGSVGSEDKAIVAFDFTPCFDDYPFCSIDVDFEYGTAHYCYKDESDELVFNTEYYLNEGEMDWYREFIQDYFGQIVEDKVKYEGDFEYEPGVVYGDSRLYWDLELTYEDGSTERIECCDHGSQIYPDRWDEFATRTNEFIDFELFM